MSEVIIIQELRQDDQTITLEQYLQKRKRRRWRVADRMYKRAPLFAVEFMRDEFPEYTAEQFVKDVTRKRRPGKKRRGKSQLKRQGRYPMMMKALAQYQLTGDLEHLHTAQKLRERLFSDMQVVFALGKERRTLTFPSTTSVDFVKSLAQIKFKSWTQLDDILDERLKYAHVS